MPFLSVLEVLTAIADVLGFVRDRRKDEPSKFDRQFDEARMATSKEGDALLVKFCDGCARLNRKHPQDAHVLHRWGNALWWRASRKSGSEADVLFEQADKKFSQAQTIAPNLGEIRADRADALRSRAALHPGETGRRMLVEVCEQGERWLGIYGRGPHDARMFGIWGLALWWLAAQEKGAEAERLYESADDKFTRGYSLDSDQTEIAVNQVEALYWRSMLASGKKQRDILERVCQHCRALADKRAGSARMLETWGGALVWLGAQAKGPEAERLYTEAEEKLSRALAINPASRLAETGRVHAMLWRAVLLRGAARQELLEKVCQDCQRLNASESKDAELLRMWGGALGWQGVAAEGETAGRLFSEAAEKFSLALAIQPGNEELVIGLAGTLYYRARVCDPEEGRVLITRSSDLLEAASREPSGYAALAWWATVLALRGKLLPGAETDRLLKEAEARFDAAKRNGIDPDALTRDRPMLVWAQAMSEAAKVQ